jgi:hypothetical protein
MCGSVNQYSSKIKVGNWVEDRFGQELAAKQQALSSQPKQPCRSVTQDAFAYAAQPRANGEHALADATTRGVSVFRSRVCAIELVADLIIYLLFVRLHSAANQGEDEGCVITSALCSCHELRAPRSFGSGEWYPILAQSH